MRVSPSWCSRLVVGWLLGVMVACSRGAGQDGTRTPTAESTTESKPEQDQAESTAGKRPAPEGWTWHRQDDAHFELLVPQEAEVTVEWYGEPAIAMQLDAQTETIGVRVELYPLEGLPDPAEAFDHAAVTERLMDDFEGSLVAMGLVNRGGFHGMGYDLVHSMAGGTTVSVKVLAVPVGGFEYRMWMYGTESTVDGLPALDSFRFLDTIDDLVVANVPDGRAFWLLGNAAARRGAYLLAARYFQAALQGGDLRIADHESILVSLLEAYRRLGRREDAEAVLERAKDSGYTSKALRHQEAQLHLAMHRHDRAATVFRGLLAGDASDARMLADHAIARIGTAHEQADAFDTAVLDEVDEALRSARERFFPAGRLRVAHAITHWARGEDAEAGRALAQAIRRQGLIAAGLLQYYLSILQIEPQAFATPVLQTMPTDADRWSVLQAEAVLLDMGSAPKARMEAWSRVVQRIPWHAHSWSRLGRARWAAQDHAGALEAFEQAYARDPHDLDIVNMLVWHLVTVPEPELRDAPRAAALSSKLLEPEFPGGPQLDTVAAARAAAGAFNEAVILQQVAIDRATQQGADPKTLEEYERRLTLYRQRKSWPPPARSQNSP